MNKSPKNLKGGKGLEEFDPFCLYIPVMEDHNLAASTM